MDKTIPEIILEAIGYIKQGWIKECLAYNEKNKSCSPTSNNAVCFCLEGAIIRACGGYNANFMKITSLIIEKLKGLYPHWWNDKPERTKEDVINLLQGLINVLR